MKNAKLLRILPWLFGLLYFILSYSLPFWGDSIASVSKAAVRIFDEGLMHPWNYPDADPGHPTLFPWIIALFWKILGFHLWVPHLLVALMSAFLIQILDHYSKLLDEKLRIWAVLLIGIAPLTLSQAIEVSLALPLSLLTFLAAIDLKKGKVLRMSLWMSLMMLIHLQGMMLVAAIGFYDLLRSWPLKLSFWKRLIWYLPPFLVFGIWLYFHQKEFGWALITPNYGRAAPGFKTIIYNLGISAWRLMDLGYFILSIPVLWALLKNLTKKKSSDQEKLFLSLFLVLCIGIPVVFAYPPNHRYIFPVYLLSVPLFLKNIQVLNDRKKVIRLSAAFLILLSGNLWYYPGKCLGDQNLVFLNYHELEKDIIQDIPEGSILYSYAPLNNNSRYTWLEEKRSVVYTDLYNRSFDSCDWIIESNVNCEFTASDRDSLSAHFVSRTYENFGVYANVWMNKRLLSIHPNFPGPARNPGFLEEKMQRLKERLKN